MIALIFLTIFTFAAEPPSCQGPMEATRAAGEVVLQGKLEAYYEQGMTRTIWGIQVDDSNNSSAGASRKRLVELHPGDELYILASDDALLVSGIYGNAFDTKNEIQKFSPRLRSGDGFTAIPDADLERKFGEGVPAVVITKRNVPAPMGLDAALAEKLRQQARTEITSTHLFQPNASLIRYGPNLVECAFLGLPTSEKGELRVTSAESSVDLKPGDLVFLLEANQVKGAIGIYAVPPKISRTTEEAIARSHACFVIRGSLIKY